MPNPARRSIPLLLAIALVACAGEPPPENVLFLVSDALRADALSCYGGRARTPNLCALAEEGVLFERAYANAPWTLPSVVGMFTGTYPLQHRRTVQGRAGEPLPFYFLDESEQLVGEAFAERGFAVSAVIENAVARQPHALQGFEIINRTRRDEGPPPARLSDDEVTGYGLSTSEPGYKLIAQSMHRLLAVCEAPLFRPITERRYRDLSHVPTTNLGGKTPAHPLR